MKAFTLIELLCVITILGLLAAIAIPNFLQAQTRAKVARMRNDTRILGMAIESYRVDHGWYPYGRNCDPMNFVCSVRGTPQIVQENKLPHLINPIRYIYSIPFDVFHGFHVPVTGEEVRYSISYVFVYQQALERDPCNGKYKTSPSVDRDLWQWSVYSIGPDKMESQFFDLATWRVMPYDPSNGILSNGDIQWSTQPPLVWDGTGQSS